MIIVTLLKEENIDSWLEIANNQQSSVLKADVLLTITTRRLCHIVNAVYMLYMLCWSTRNKNNSERKGFRTGVSILLSSPVKI